MSKQSEGKPTVADSARREAKLLARPTKLTLDPFGKTEVELKQPFPKELGEHSVIVVVTRLSSTQFTIAHPIGITDLAQDDWVAHRSDQIQGLIARAEDPSQARLNQTWTNARLDLAASHGLLIIKEEGGKKVFYYPCRTTMSRNEFLEGARDLAKDTVRRIKEHIAALKKDEMHLKTGLNNQLQGAANPIQYLDKEVAEAEQQLRAYWSAPEVIKWISVNYPQTYRTLSGPYFTVPQVALPGMRGKSIEEVCTYFARKIANASITEIGEPGFPATKDSGQKTKGETPGKVPPPKPMVSIDNGGTDVEKKKTSSYLGKSAALLGLTSGGAPATPKPETEKGKATQ